MRVLVLILSLLVSAAAPKPAEISEGEKYLKYEWKVVTASSYINSGDADRLIQSNLKAIRALVAAEAVEGKGRFLDQIMNGCWLLSEQKTWATVGTVRSMKRDGSRLPLYSESFVDAQTMECVEILEDAMKRFGSIWDKEDPSICWSIRNAIGRQLSSSPRPEAGNQRD